MAGKVLVKLHSLLRVKWPKCHGCLLFAQHFKTVKPIDDHGIANNISSIPLRDGSAKKAVYHFVYSRFHIFLLTLKSSMKKILGWSSSRKL